ncbi:hypothetical protein IWW34DRAFT_772274 [Fusarium oxysporum f. sp. albedinis]|nr:hypothetical protein IWW34DRAFT_772274 [Fusarium oxysporum f. sp. albedinis]KAJ0125600.1 putative RNA-directed DNA polymerase from transposon BS [Fusarium oxysporum f. sp. albedinis]KAJ0127337.1 Serine/threonine-protein kinase max-2 [Fusarium oxysporum f. sp. albedinis]
MHPFTALSATFVAIMSPALINAQSAVSTAVAPAPTGMGCICMAPTSSGKDEAMYDRTWRCCRQEQGHMRSTNDFWGRGSFYCNFEKGINPAEWDGNCCRTVFGDGTYGFCNKAV